MIEKGNPFLALRVWSSSSRQALNKPLLILFALGRLSRGLREVSFTEAEADLKNLLREFGGDVHHPRPEYPFWRLQNDGIWVVSPDNFQPNAAGDVPVTALRDGGAKGRFSNEVLSWLLADRDRISAVAQGVLNAYFSDSFHQDLLNAVGILPPESVITRRRRDPAFRSAVLTAYRQRCAVCSQDIRIGALTVGLEAAHIQWHQAGGPDSIDNGLSLCSLHHKLFDLGAFTLSENRRILVSEHVTGTERLEEVLMRYHGNAIALPAHNTQQASLNFIHWHRHVRFREKPLP